MSRHWIRSLLPCLAVLAFAAPADAQYGRDHDDRYDRGRVVRCESIDQRTRHCDMDTRGGVRLVEQHSQSACVQGRSWGWDSRGVWVSQGCRADFVGGYDHDSGWGNGEIVRCESYGNGTRHCNVDTRWGVRLLRQLSREACIEGRSWGWDRQGIWVTRGCRAEFLLGRRGGGTTTRRLVCESQDERPRHCDADVRYGVRLVRQISRSACIRGQSWGTDARGIWVSRGCRAEFEVSGYGTGAGWGEQISCDSVDGRYRLCRARGQVRGAELIRRRSNASCTYNRSWGYTRDGVWVDGGCRADFRVY
jgi:hypothetical protein